MAAMRELDLAEKAAENSELLLRHGAVPSDKNLQNRGRYDYEFVEPPPSVFQTECPICLQVLKEPCLISCCGHKFCRECIERIEKDQKPCPLCNEPDFTFMRDGGLERSLKDLEVWCYYRKEGCEWKGKLGNLEKHLNRDSFPENRLNGCYFVAVECMHNCGELFQRCHITTHETQQCNKRPYSCEYCQDYHSTFEDVIEVHHHQCGKYPVACPNDCDVHMIERENVESHLKEQCSLTLIDCPFYFAGCEMQFPRKYMSEHMKDNSSHLMLLARATQRLVKENQELRQNMEGLLQKQQFTENEVGALKKGVQMQKLDVQQHPGVPVDLYVKQTNEEVYSPPFYTHPHGYLMCIRVCPNGYGDGWGTHVSIYTYIMQGPFDDSLKWPFRGQITIQIVNVIRDNDHVEKIIDYTDKTPDDTAGRVINKERSDHGWGKRQFLAHNKLHYNAERKTQYLKNDTLHIRIVKVTLPNLLCE